MSLEVFRLIIALIITTTAPPPANDWVTCGYTPLPYEEMYETTVGGQKFQVGVELTDPSCPGINDGSIRVTSTFLDNNARTMPIELQTDLVNSSASNFTIVGKDYFNLGGGTYKILLQFPGQQFRSFDVNLREPVTPDLYIRSVGSETCPGAEDGFVVLGLRGPSDNISQVQWDDGTVGPGRVGLGAGTYPFTFWTSDGHADCCTEGEVTIFSSQCLVQVLTWSFVNGIPPGGFEVPNGVLVPMDGLGQYTQDGTVTIPFDQVFQAYVLAYFFFSGSGQIRAFDQDFQTIATQTISGTGYVQFIFQKAVSHFYLEITGAAGSQMGEMNVFQLDSDPGSPSASLSSGSEDQRAVPQTVCVGDTLIPYSGLSLSGGLTPYSFDWDADGDGVFGDADSLGHPVVFDSAGLYEIMLIVTDQVQQSDTVLFEYEVVESAPVVFDVENLGLEQVGFEVVSVCTDQEPFMITGLGDGVQITSTSTGWDGEIFDPQAAGPGEHLITMHRNQCSEDGGLFVIVFDRPDASVATIDTQYLCSAPIVLSSLVEGDTTGIWILDTLEIVLNDTIDPASLDPGTYELRYTIGEDLCLSASLQELVIEMSPVADLASFDDTLFTDDDPFNLNTLLGNSTSGGTWSGGEFISGSTFDPEGLAPGGYNVIYSVGEGTCAVSDTVEIFVDQSTSVRTPEDMVLTCWPNPTSGQLFVQWDRILPEGVEILMTDLNGRQYDMQASPTANGFELNLTRLVSGIYLLKVSDPQSGMLGVMRVIVF